MNAKETIGLARKKAFEAGKREGKRELVKYLDERSFSFQPKGEAAVWVITCDRQGLLKEVGLTK